MKTNKTQATLYIFHSLLKNGYIVKNEIQETLEINDLTFKRYIQELRAFLINYNLGYEIVFIKEKNKYFLEKF